MNEGKMCVCTGTLVDDGAGNCVGKSEHITIISQNYVRSCKGSLYLSVQA